MLFVLLAAILVSLNGYNVEAEDVYRAPLYDRGSPDEASNLYIVMFDRGYAIDDHWRSIGKNFSSLPGFRRWKPFFAYTAELNATTLECVRRDQSVSFVERNYRAFPELDRKPVSSSDSVVEPYMLDNITGSIDGLDQLDVSIDRCDDSKSDDWTVRRQLGPPWSLAVISAGHKMSRPAVINGRWAVEWRFISNAGTGVDIYVTDTGVNIHHEYFNGKAQNFGGLSSVEPAPYADKKRPVIDVYNHGTPVAGIVGASKLGVARSANLINVPIFNHDHGTAAGNSEGTMIADILLALNAITLSHIDRCRIHPPDDLSFRGSIIVASWQFETHRFSLDQKDTMEAVIAYARSYGIEVIAASGNQGKSMMPRTVWPCTMPGVICVGSIDQNYDIPEYSNILYRKYYDAYAIGEPEFYLAPGESITTTDFAGGSERDFVSGTSFAAPHVAGVAAMFMGYLGLAAGGVNQYLARNALHGICRSVDPERKIVRKDNRLVNTGLHNPHKQADEPFRGAPNRPVPLRQECPNIQDVD